MYSEKVVGPRLSTKKEVKCLPAIGFSCLLFYALCFYGRVVLGTGEGSIVITESSSGVGYRGGVNCNYRILLWGRA